MFLTMIILFVAAFILHSFAQPVCAFAEFPNNNIVLPSITPYELRFAIKRLSIRREWRDTSDTSLNGVAATFALRKPHYARDGLYDGFLDTCIGTMNDTESAWHNCTGPSREISGKPDNADQPWLKWRISYLDELPKSTTGNSPEMPFRSANFELILGRM